MSVSTKLITDMASVISAGPNAATIAKAIAAAGPINGYVSNSKAAYLKLQEAEVMAKNLYDVTDAADTANKANLSGIYDVLRGSGSPSDSVITDMASVISTGPGVATKAACLTAAGPIQDYVGRCKLLKEKFQELYNLVLLLNNSTDATDSVSLGHLADILLALS
jgi:hypothetical protein